MLPLRAAPSAAERAALLDVARARRPPDLVVSGGTIANVYSGEWLPGNVEIAGGWIAYVGPRTPLVADGTRVLDAAGCVVTPGYIEAHAHPWVLYNPQSLVEAAVPGGTTTLVLDNLFFMLQGGAERFGVLVERMRGLPAHVFWMARVASQTATAAVPACFAPEVVERVLDWPEVVGTAEITRWPEIVAGNPALLAGMAAARRRGKRADGHAAGASYDRLAALAAAGVSADHEAIGPAEAIDRLRLGFWTMLRHSSLRRDLPALAAGLHSSGVDLRRVLLTTDGSAPVFYAEHGVIDGALDAAVARGIDPMAALQMVTVNAATFLGLDDELGGIAPGRRATMNVLPSRGRFRADQVIVDGRVVARAGRLEDVLAPVEWSALGFEPAFASPERFADPAMYGLRAEASRSVVVMRFDSAVISRRDDRTFAARGGTVDLDGQPGCVHAALVDREGRWIARGVVSGLFDALDGLAATYNTTTHLLVLGRDVRSMAAAAARVAELRGGIAFAERGAVVWAAPLPVAGMMMPTPFGEAVRVERELQALAERASYRFHDILYSLLFLPCDFLPDVRLTPMGLVDVKSRAIVEPAEALAAAPAGTHSQE